MMVTYLRAAAVAAVSLAAIVGYAVADRRGEGPTSVSPARDTGSTADLNGIWQALTPAYEDIQDHSATDGVPAGQGIVEGNVIPYQPWAAAKKREHDGRRKTADPLGKCYLPGVPRVMYLPFPLEIVQTPTQVVILSEFAHAVRVIYTNGTEHARPLQLWMGDSRGRWEGDTLVVDVSEFTDQTWFDTAGNFHSDALHIVERYRRTSPDILQYEATIEDPKVLTRPFKMSFPLYRRQEKNVQLLDYECVGFQEPFMTLEELKRAAGGGQ